MLPLERKCVYLVNKFMLFLVLSGNECIRYRYIHNIKLRVVIENVVIKKSVL